MEEKGYLVLVLHGHQPFVRHPDIDHPQEEDWLFETLTDCYLPITWVCEELLDEGIKAGLTLSLSPTLCAMLSDSYRRKRYIRYLQERIRFLEQGARRAGGMELDEGLASWYRDRFAKCRRVVEDHVSGDVVGRCRRLQEQGAISVIASTATHPYLPLWQLHPDIVRLQVRVGTLQYERDFGRIPSGFWLPECGYSPGIDEHLRQGGLNHFFLARHGLLNGLPSPRYGEFAAAQTPCGVKVLARDTLTDHQVAFKNIGYPGDPVYAAFESDIGLTWPSQAVHELTHRDGPATAGIRCRRAGTNAWEPCDPQAAAARCQVHATHFVQQCRRRVETLHAALGRKPVIVGLYDMEHFGHWWLEGPLWLKLVIRELAAEPGSAKLLTAGEYLALHPECETVNPSMSSWGFQGYSETWLMGRNHWIYPALYKAIDVFRALTVNHQHSGELCRAALSQYLRELLLAQASDWAFILHAETAAEYTTRRVRGHLANMAAIHTGLERNCLDSDWLASLQDQNSIFADVDLLKCYREIACLPPEASARRTASSFVADDS